MKPLRIVVILIAVVVLIGGIWLWWSQPRNADMAGYVPGDTVIYLEFNSALKLSNSIEQNDTWQALAPSLGLPTKASDGLQPFLAKAGIGPAEGVIFSRAQFALAVVGVNQIQTDDTLRVRPEVALVVETHTASWRIRPVVRKAILQLSTFAYKQPTCAERPGNSNFIECIEAGSDRRLIAAVDGSVAVIGNDEKAVQACLDVQHGSRPSLLTNGEMVKVRSEVAVPGSLAFGYISAASSARLFAWAGPLMIGKPGDPQLSELLERSANKILGGVAWTATPAAGGIEDRFVVALDPAVAARLQPAFMTSPPDEGFWNLIPTNFQSATIYGNNDPLAAWSALSAALAVKLDAVSAVLFGSVLKSSLAGYGVDNPNTLLATLKPPVMTVMPAPTADGSVLIARVGDATNLRRSIAEQNKDMSVVEGPQAQLDERKEFASVTLDNYVVLGKTENVKEYLLALRSGHVAGKSLEKASHFAPESRTPIVTYATDDQRVQTFMTVIASIKKGEAANLHIEDTQNNPRYWNFSATESSLTTNGIERRTRSAFGQFSSLLSLLKQDVSAARRK